MKPPVVIATLIAALILAPIAIIRGDMLIVCLAGLIPFFADSSKDDSTG